MSCCDFSLCLRRRYVRRIESPLSPQCDRRMMNPLLLAPLAYDHAPRQIPTGGLIVVPMVCRFLLRRNGKHSGMDFTFRRP